MPSRKQRRRREKAFRHEYETLLLDEEGNEIPLDPEEREKQRAEREQKRAAKPKEQAAKGGKRERPVRVPPEPSWNRALRRGGLMGALMFVLFVFFLHGGSQTSRAGIAVVYAVMFIPLTYFVDRVAYRSYQRRIGRTSETKKS